MDSSTTDKSDVEDINDEIDNIYDVNHDKESTEYDNIVYELSNTPVEEIIQRKVCKYIRELDSFFRIGNFGVEKGDFSTNIIDVSKRRCYNVPKGSIETFFTCLENCRKAGRMLHYNERQFTDTITHSGILIDFDRYQNSQTSQITERHITLLCSMIITVLNSFIRFSEVSIHIFVTRKPSVVPAVLKTGQTVYKDGFHLVLPEVMICKGAKKYLIEEILSRKLLSKVFSDIENIEPPEAMLDRASATNPMHFFGNSKVDKPSYLLTNIYRYEFMCDDMISTCVRLTADDFKEYNLCYELSLCWYLQTFNGKPTVMNKKQYNYKQEYETKIQLLIEKTHLDIIPKDSIMENESSIDLLTISDPIAGKLKKLLDILDSSYATDYEKWFKVICAIANTNPRYKDLAIHFSQRRPQDWSEIEFERVWNDIVSARKHNNPLTFKSIIYWAKQSSPVRYKELQNTDYSKLLRNYVYENEGRVEHAMVARLLHEMFSEKFAVDVETADDNSRKIYRWYEFVIDGQQMRKGEIFKWRREADPDNIHLYISEHMTKIYKTVAEDIKTIKDKAENDALMKYWDKVEKTFKQYMSKLSENGFQVGVIKQAQYRFRMRGFLDELDSYEDVLGVGNGILLLGTKAKFIRGYHEYKISKYTDTDYVPYEPENPIIKELLRVVHEIFPEEDVFNFMWLHASTWLDACDPACLLLLLVGGGQNGKSFFLRMIHNALGNMYVSSGKIALLSSPNEKAESANSAQCHMKNKRGFYFEEANKCEVLNSSRVKTITSPGYQSGRDLHQKQENFRNTCNPIAASNYDYIAECTDHGFWRRIYYYKNKVKFCKNPDPKNPYEKKEDPNIMRVYPNNTLYKQAALSILVHYNEILRTKYNNDLKQVPVPTILAETYKFRRRQDSLHRFITEMIVESPNAEDISTYTIAMKYQEWYARVIKNASPTVNEIMSQLENSCLAQHFESRGGHNHLLYLKGHRMKHSVEDPTLENEKDLIPADLKESITNEQNEINNTLIEIDKPPVDNFIKELSNHDSDYIQTREIKNTSLTEPNNDAINTFLINICNQNIDSNIVDSNIVDSNIVDSNIDDSNIVDNNDIVDNNKTEII
jgi:phage/plasmid-associated DNA primase